MQKNNMEDRLIELGIALPAPVPPAANYVPLTRSGRLAYVSGQGPILDGKVVFAGVVGQNVSEQQAYEAARMAAINALAVLRDGLGSLDRVSRILKVLTFVRCVPGFERQHLVANGASDLLVELFGERGLHARSAVSSPDLPFGICVEVELVVETVDAC